MGSPQQAAVDKDAAESAGQVHPMRRWLQFLIGSRSSLMGAILLLIILFLAVFGPSFAPADPTAVDVGARLKPPSAEHWLGTDQYGRDVLSRMLYGASYTVWIGMACVLVSAVTGTFLGAISGYFGGRIDQVLGRFMDVLLAFPGIFLGLAVVAAFGPGTNNVILAVGVVGVPRFYRMARGGVLSIKQRDFVEAALANGTSHWRILFRHILPNAAGPLVVYATLWSANAVIYAAGLSFLGVGVQQPTPEWGSLLSDAQRFALRQPTLSIFPGAALTLLVLGLNLLGDGLRDYLDPRTLRSGGIE